jgi:DNA repair photolyase
MHENQDGRDNQETDGKPDDRAVRNRAVYKGRGAISNAQSRFLPTRSTPVADGWSAEPEIPPRPETRLHPDRTVRLITRNRSPDIPFDRSINPYKGCEHGCVYCFARPTHAYLDLSPGLDFETRLFYKTDVRKHLEAELGARSYECRPIALGTNTDPYQPAEKKLRITRQILETLLEWRHPVTIVTKGQLLLRDLDLLSELAALDLVRVSVSVTTLRNELKTRLEPRTASPAARLRMIEELSKAGVPVGAMVAPVIPFVNDEEIEDIVAACAGAGAQSAAYILLRLPREVGPLFQEWLDEHYPLKARRVESAIRQMRGGKLYRSGWSRRMTGSGPVADLIGGRFAKALKANDLNPVQDEPALRTDLFQPPIQQAQLF